jgi:hypothetical protein
MTKNGIVVILVSSCVIVCSCQKRLLGLNGFSKGQITYVNEKVDSSLLIQRIDKRIVILSFYEVFDDSVVVILGKRKLWSGSIYKNQNPFSSFGWSGHDLSCDLKRSNTNVTIKLVHQRQYIKFRMYSDIPAYMIQRYNDIWYVRSLKSSLKMR